MLAQKILPGVIEGQTRPTTNSTAELEKAKGVKTTPTDTNLNTETQDPSRFGVGEREGDSGNFNPYAPKEPNKFQKTLNDIKTGVQNWATGQTAKAIENATPPEVDWTKAGETLQESHEKGLQANRAIQNSEIPKWKRMTINDVLFNPEYQGIRDSIASQAVNARGANFLKGLAGKDGNYTSAIDQYNNQQAQRYSDAVADRDTRALEAQLQADEAANKRDVGAELQRADTYLGRELDRWGLLYDTETKKQVLDQMVADSKAFAQALPNPEDRLMLTAYQQYLSGDATALDSIVSTYGTQILDKVSDLVDWVKTLAGGGTPKASLKIGNQTFTEDQLKNLGVNGIDAELQKLPLEDQKAFIDEYKKEYGGRDATKLEELYNGRSRQDEVEKELIKQANERADEIEATIAEIKNDYTGKQKEKALQALKDDLDKNISIGLKQTDKINTAKANLEHELSLAKLANEAVAVDKPLNTATKGVVDSNGKVDEKRAMESLNYLKDLGWKTFIANNTPSVADEDMSKTAVMETQGFKDVVNLLSNPNLQNYISTGTDRKNKLSSYKMAVDNFLNTFGGTEKDYGFATYSWDDINRL